ncbi:lipoprotein LpqH [Mycobacterium sp. PSTR-4-N]|uniref:lipoprotein LpqH n=1 Tax=Mycobacterium sp. PSTR-4-N TaxID=2917745 RepID=UPI0035B25305
MRGAWAGAAAAVLAGCSSAPPPYDPPPGQLVAGTAQVSVNGQDLGRTESVRCTPAGSLMTIETGDDSRGVSAMVSNADGLVVRQVGITDLGGFTGSYNAGLGGDASVSMTGRTYEITGTADGFATDSPSFRTSGTFTIAVSC